MFSLSSPPFNEAGDFSSHTQFTSYTESDPPSPTVSSISYFQSVSSCSSSSSPLNHPLALSSHSQSRSTDAVTSVAVNTSPPTAAVNADTEPAFTIINADMPGEFRVPICPVSGSVQMWQNILLQSEDQTKSILGQSLQLSRIAFSDSVADKLGHSLAFFKRTLRTDKRSDMLHCDDAEKADRYSTV